jgi:cytochrome c oxidase subunit 2
MSKWNQINFQNAASPIIEQLIFLHDHTISILLIIVFIVLYSLLFVFFISITKKKQTENHLLETIWTLLPGCILILIALPSLRILYLSEETENHPLILKTIGHQWYWTYEYNSFKTLEFDSFIETSNNKHFRLLDTDNVIRIPTKTPIQLLISSSDVLHAWTIPSLGVKADSVPGRINCISFIVLLPSFIYGQCSEICGSNHSFMPITLNIIPLKYFKFWTTTIFLKE